MTGSDGGYNPVRNPQASDVATCPECGAVYARIGLVPCGSYYEPESDFCWLLECPTHGEVLEGGDA